MTTSITNSSSFCSFNKNTYMLSLLSIINEENSSSSPKISFGFDSVQKEPLGLVGAQEELKI